jgi:hypothetical protein
MPGSLTTTTQTRDVGAFGRAEPTAALVVKIRHLSPPLDTDFRGFCPISEGTKCQILTSYCRGFITGVAYSFLKELTTGAGRECIYGSQDTQLREVVVQWLRSHAADRHQWSPVAATVDALSKMCPGS